MGMPRGVRFVPDGGSLVEVTVRTVQSRLLLRPSPSLNETVIGVLGRAQRLYDVRCSCVVFVSNHWHALLSAQDAEQLSRFMQYVNSNVAREVGDLVDWSGPFWARRYSAIVVSEEETAQVARLRYCLAHGVKENLVERVDQWPGVHSARAILDDKSLQGYWFDRTRAATRTALMVISVQRSVAVTGGTPSTVAPGELARPAASRRASAGRNGRSIVADGIAADGIRAGLDEGQGWLAGRWRNEPARVGAEELRSGLICRALSERGWSQCEHENDDTCEGHEQAFHVSFLLPCREQVLRLSWSWVPLKNAGA